MELPEHLLTAYNSGRDIVRQAKAQTLPEGFVLDPPASAAPAVPDGFVLDQPSVAADVAKSGGVGLAKGAIGLAGFPGDLASLVGSGADWAAQKITGEKPVSTPPILPTSESVQKGVESVTGPLYEPKTTAGEYAQTVGEFAPAAIGGPGGLIRRVAQVVVPAIASEAAGQATKGTEAEPYARTSAAILGGAGASWAMRPSAVAAPSTERIAIAADKGYETSREIGGSAKSSDLIPVAKDTKIELYSPKLGISRDQAPLTYGVLDKWSDPATATLNISDIQTTRQELRNIANNPLAGSDRKAASIALKNLEGYVKDNPDLAPAYAKMREADKNYASTKTLEELAFKGEKATNNAGAANSGRNFENSLRQQIKTILNNKSELGKYTPDELDMMRKFVRGTVPAEIIRTLGNMMAGGGGIGAPLVGAAAAYETGDPRFMALPIVGMGVKSLGNRMAARKVAAIEEAIRARSPLGQQLGAGTRPDMGFSPLISLGATVAPQLARPVDQYGR